MRWLLITISLLSVLPASAAAARSTLELEAQNGDRTREYEVKAAFVYNFLQFIDWPSDAFASADAPLVIGVVGRDPFDGSLQRVVGGKTVHNRQIVVRHLRRDDSPRDCHVLFFGSADESGLEAALNGGSSPILTIGETERFLRSGGTIRFLLEENKVRFEVNVAAAERARLRISAKLLKLARIYRGRS